MRVSVLLRMIGAVALAALAACGTRQVVRPGLLIPPACEIVPRPAEGADTVRVALFDAPRPEHAPSAGNAGERLLFRQLYETLITVDCLGGVRPGLAGSWDREGGGRRWTFELRGDARFWDGTPVTARDVVESWRYTALDPMTRGAGIDSVTVAGDRILHVYFSQPHRGIPRVLTAPVYAVAKSTWESRWPHGSGPYRIVASERDSPWSSWHTVTVQPAFGAESPVIRFLETPLRDARDLLEGGIDVMVTSDPAVIEYAAGRPHFETAALPWDKTYVILAPSRIEALRLGSDPDKIPPDLSDELARDAVRGDARGHRPPFWWDDLDRCGDLTVDVPWRTAGTRGEHASSGERRILYDTGDPVARDLAERIVALAVTDPATSAGSAAVIAALPGLDGDAHGIIAEGMTQRELDGSLLYGDDFAYIVPIPAIPHDPCQEARALIHRAQWLAGLERGFSKALLPLVDTRSHVIVRSGTVGLVVDWYGDILIMNGEVQGR